MRTCLRILLLSCALASFGQSLAGQTRTHDLPDGIALVTSHQGEVTIQSAEGKIRAAELHAVETLTGLEITSADGDYIFFSLSNGIGLGVYGNSRVHFKHYQQRPFPAEKENLEYEPTLSKLNVELLEGSLIFSAEHLSPLSEIVIQLPQGQVQISRGSGRVHYGGSDALISITSGIITYSYPNTSEQEFIHAPNQVRISDASARRGRIVESKSIASDPASEVTKHLVDAARHASERVAFRVVGAGASIPQPVLVAKPKALQQPSPRPYRYLD
jgi:hypothetical protein